MALSTAEANRLEDVEDMINELYVLMRGAASRNMLNRLIVLYRNEIMNIESRVDQLEIDMQTILTLARRVQ